ncbi:MAG TPA: ATP-binding protein [Alicycliphilus sp.]|nr:ATP-binding protein [Alicycliphilus sp.]
MSLEGQHLDRKSLRAVTGKTADWPELAKDCVAFANALGGQLLIGIEDGEELPPQAQRIRPELLDTLRRRIAELTVPLGVTPDNVLHASVRRNPHLARLCHDLKLMESEGSGFDAMYDVLLSQGRPAPVVEEGPDWVRVTLARTLPDRHVLAFIAKAGGAYPLTQRERITLGLLARHEALTARELEVQLELANAEQLRPWLGRLCDWALVGQTGRTQATRYFVKPELLRSLAFPAATTLKLVEDHRLQALVLEDVGRYPASAIGEIHRRIGVEIPRRRVQGMLARLVKDGQVCVKGERRWARYSLPL